MKCTDLKDWNKMPVDERLKVLFYWSKYENYEYISRCRTVGDLEELYAFLHFDIGVDFVAEVYDVVDSEIDHFNEKLGYVLI